MVIFKKIKDLQKHLKAVKKNGKSVGFAPTMGALHAGHITLIKVSKKHNDLTVCSIFVNPTQFNDKKDFNKYPITIDEDVKKLEKAGCDVLFLPSVKEMYPKGFANKTRLKFGFLAQTLEGEHRPGHFEGMAQIVEKLLKIVQPDTLYMGQKDYQQQLIVRQLIKKRKFKTELAVVPTVREKDGLAMSSRNVRLDKKARKTAVEISKTLKGVKAAVGKSKSIIEQVEKWGLARLSNIKGVEPEYFQIRNAETLQPAQSKAEPLVALTAVNIGGVRLIDNMLLNYACN